MLTNVRCLSEGVDVPALDAVLFLSSRSSQVDVVQSVGRVMRSFRRGQPEEKKYGYILIPVVIPEGESAEEALSQNHYKVVWDILNALRATMTTSMLWSIALRSISRRALRLSSLPQMLPILLMPVTTFPRGRELLVSEAKVRTMRPRIPLCLHRASP